MRQKLTLSLFLIPFVIVADQGTKLWVHRHFRWGESVTIVPSFFALTYVRNPGAAFGLFQKVSGGLKDSLFIVLPLLAIAALSLLILRLDSRRWLSLAALMLIISGAVANLIDRLRLGFVIDFLDFHWKEFYHWPAFNIADSCIVVGVALMFLESFRSDSKDSESILDSSLSDRSTHAKEGNPDLGKSGSPE